MNKNMSSEKMIMPIGKYKGQPIEAIQHDKNYIDWLCQQSWFREEYGDTYQIIINNFQEPTETPEHNQLQAMFLNESFIKCFCDYYYKEYDKLKINTDINTLKELINDRRIIRFILKNTTPIELTYYQENGCYNNQKPRYVKDECRRNKEELSLSQFDRTILFLCKVINKKRKWILLKV